jgi:hypothetical protein
VRFAIFTDHLCRIATKVDGWPQKFFELLATPGVLHRQLALHQAPQQTAAGLLAGSRLRIETLEQIVWEGDHHLCHRVSIYGIANG